MARYVVYLDVMPRTGVADPPGQAACSALAALGFAEVREVRIGRRIAVELEAPDEHRAAARVRAMAEQLLANPVIEEFSVSLPCSPRRAAPEAEASSPRRAAPEAGACSPCPAAPEAGACSPRLGAPEAEEGSR